MTKIVLHPTNPLVTRTIFIGYKDKTSLSIVRKYFISYLRQHIDKLPYKEIKSVTLF